MEIKDKVIWVTGGNSGLGLAAAQYFIKEGAKVMITARRRELLEKYADEMGDNCIWFSADNTKLDELKAAVKFCVDTFGRLDVLLNSAGAGSNARIVAEDSTTDEDSVQWDSTIALNLTGSFNTARLAVNEMQKNEPNEHGERGVILLVSSVNADKIGTGGMTAYAASKAGVLGLVNEAGVSLGEHGIRIVAVQPGIFTTPLIDIPHPAYDYMRNLFTSRNCMPKGVGPAFEGNPEMFASLCGEIVQNWCITRTSIKIDNGYVG